MSESRAADGGRDKPSSAQLKEFHAQIESGRITKSRLQKFLQLREPDEERTKRGFLIKMAVGIAGLIVMLALLSIPMWIALPFAGWAEASMIMSIVWIFAFVLFILGHLVYWLGSDLLPQRTKR